MNPAPLRHIELDTAPGFAEFQGGARGPAHNEAAFRHFLGIELRRARRSGLPVLLVLVSIRASDGKSAPLGAASASVIFAALGASTRDVDFVGWFRERRVAAAALIQCTTPAATIRDRIASRVSETLRGQLRATPQQVRIRIATLRGLSDR